LYGADDFNTELLISWQHYKIILLFEL